MREATAASLLREARGAGRLTQVELAERSGVTQSVISAYESGRREPSLPMLQRLIESTGQQLELSIRPLDRDARTLPSTGLGRMIRQRRARINELAARHGARNVRVFGSAARGDDTSSSDVDLLVDLDEKVGLIELTALERELSELLDRRVDVVPAPMLKPHVRPSAEADAIPL